MSDEHNPLLPTGYDIAWSVVSVLVLALIIVALISLARSARRLTAAQGLFWTVVILFVPIAGPVSWPSIGRRAGIARQNTSY